MPFSFPPPDQLTHMEQYDDPSEYPYPGVPVDRRSCRLLGPTALVVQALMGVLVVASLVLKRQREKPKRPWRIWVFDVSKQILGQGFVHGLNLLISDIVAHLAQGNPCDLYFLNVLIDTTLGVAYIYLITHGANVLLTDRLHLKGFRSGQYGDPPLMSYWARQAIVYVVTILSMKLLVVGLFAAWPGIFNVGEWLLSWTGGDDRLQVVFVMGIFPIIMNVLQFWLIDSIVKASASAAPKDSAAAAADNDASREPLIRDPDPDQEDDDETIRAQRRHDIESPPTPQNVAKSPPHKDNSSEHKSTASGSSISRVQSASSIKLHSYPPDASSASSPASARYTPTSASVSSSSSSSSLASKKSKRRSPPPPIQRPPPQLMNSTAYTISMTPSPPPTRRTSQRSLSSYSNTTPSPPQSQARQRHRSSRSQGIKAFTKSEEGWENWTHGEDWAEKVGEEDWTGRRMGATKANLEAWGSKGGVGVVGVL